MIFMNIWHFPWILTSHWFLMAPYLPQNDTSWYLWIFTTIKMNSIFYWFWPKLVVIWPYLCQIKELWDNKGIFEILRLNEIRILHLFVNIFIFSIFENFEHGQGSLKFFRKFESPITSSNPWVISSKGYFLSPKTKIKVTPVEIAKFNRNGLPKDSFLKEKFFRISWIKL